MLPAFFELHEKNLRKKIDSGDAPFISLYSDDMLPKTAALLSDVFTQPHTVSDVIESFLYFPALTTSHLTASISDSDAETMLIWPAIEAAFGLKNISNDERKELWQAFRDACKELDLPVPAQDSGSRYMINTFLYHTGVMKKFAQDLAFEMTQLGKRIGSPDLEDPDSLAMWTHELLEKRLKPPFSKITHEAIQRDTQQYYSNIFWQLNLGQRDACNEFEKSLLLQQDTESFSKKTRIQLPKIICNNGIVSLFIPENLDLQSICIDECMYDSEQAELEDLFILQSNDNPLPKNIVIKSQRGEWNFNLWADEKNNRMLLFGGRDKHLIETPVFGQEYTLSPGEYELLCRFEPEIEDAEIEFLQDEPEMYLARILLRPDEKVSIVRGSATITFIGASTPLIQIIGEKHLIDAQGTKVWTSAGIAVKVSIPDSLSHDFLSINLRSTFFGQHTIDINPIGSSHSYQHNLENIFVSLPAGLGLVTVECYKQGRARTLAKMATLVWNGLQDKDTRGELHCLRRPENYDSETSVNTLEEDGDNYKLHIKEISNRQWVTSFTNGRKLHWLRPGRYIELRTYENGTYTTMPLQEGGNLLLHTTGNTTKELRISGLSDGKLCLGDREWSTSATKSTIQIPVPTLLEAATKTDWILTFYTLLDEDIPLLSIMQQSTIKDYYAQYYEGDFTIKFSLHEDIIDDVEITIENMLTGDTYSRNTTYLECDKDDVVQCRNGVIYVRKETESTFQAMFTAENWDAGIYYVSFKILRNGTWRRITNARGDVFSSIFATYCNKFINPPHFISTLNSHKDKMYLLNSLQPKVLTCYAKECWCGDAGLEWLPEYWSKLALEMFEVSRQGTAYDVKSFLQLLEYGPAPENGSSWVPLLSLHTECPQALSLDAENYKNLAENTHFTSCLRHLTRLQDPLKSCHDQDIDPFVGIASTAPGKPSVITNFQLSKLIECWLSISDITTSRSDFQQWRPGRGDFLGREQYRYALKKLSDRLEEVDQIGANSSRKNESLRICKRPAIWNKLLPYASRETWEKFFLYFHSQLLEDEKELWSGRLALIASFAFLCRESAHSGDNIEDLVHTYLNSIRQNEMTLFSARSTLNYIVTIGEDVLGFFLLLAELQLQTKKLSIN